MGASAWEYVVPYGADLSAVLGALRERVFAEGDYVSPVDFGLTAPASLDDLEQEEYGEFMGTCGTHSILDVIGIAGDGGQDFAMVQPLADDESHAVFGTSHPGRADFDRLAETGALYDSVTERGTGRCAVLWDGDAPAEIAFWGYSGD